MERMALSDEERIDLGSSLGPEERKELAFGLLRNWWIAATQALVDEAGSEVALRSLRPYFINTGVAGAHNIQTIMGISAEELLRRDVIGDVWSTVMGGKTERRYRARDGSAINDMVDCATKGISREGCVSFCGYASAAYTPELDPTLRYSLVKSLSFGDPFCRWCAEPEGEEPVVSDSDRFLLGAEYFPSLEDELKDYLALSVIGEAWTNATKAFMDIVGQERAQERLRSHMRHSGLSLGMRMSSPVASENGRVDAVVSLVQLVQDLHLRNGTRTRTSNGAEGEVAECPFSSSPPEICAQYEAFFNGICEALDPEYEFAYDRKMTKGDESCHWAIRRKGTIELEEPNEKGEDEEALHILRRRFARGEINEEEYRRSRDVLLER